MTIYPQIYKTLLHPEYLSPKVIFINQHLPAKPLSSQRLRPLSGVDLPHGILLMTLRFDNERCSKYEVLTLLSLENSGTSTILMYDVIFLPGINAVSTVLPNTTS
jgi:hypothetical protein